MALFWIRRTNDGRLLRDGPRTLLRSNDAQGCQGSCLKTRCTTLVPMPSFLPILRMPSPLALNSSIRASTGA